MEHDNCKYRGVATLLINPIAVKAADDGRKSVIGRDVIGQTIDRQ